MRSRVLAVTLFLLIAAAAEAGLSKAAEEWRRGPDRFLFTEEDEKAWKSVDTDARAAEFIDLFWARRDPTPGTPENELRDEFLRRVRYSDSAFEEKKRRGALSDRGQVYIVLGPPEEGERTSMAISGPRNFSSSAGARRSSRVEWTWTRDEAKALGVPKLHATFNQSIGTETYVRDTKNGVFANVRSKALRSYVFDPAMTEVPDWAGRVSREVLAAATNAAAPKAVSRIGRLVLLRNLDALDLETATDPLAPLQRVTEFPAGSDLAFVLEYCGRLEPIKFEAKINNMVAGSQVEPLPMKGVAGCGAIPSMLSLVSLGPGSYELEITTTEPGGTRDTAKQQFTVK